MKALSNAFCIYTITSVWDPHTQKNIHEYFSNTVVCEETSRTVHRHTREVVYVQEEQDRSQNGALEDTTQQTHNVTLTLAQGYILVTEF